VIVLLDANVLIALADADHIHSTCALQFFEDDALRTGWATCPLTENAFLRIFGGRTYPGGPGNTAGARQVLLTITGNPGHQFWSDDLTLTAPKVFPRLPTSHGLTVCYLLALAVKHGGRLATFDRGIDASLVFGGSQALTMIPYA